MLKTLIVDDEISVRSRLWNIIDWEEQGFVISGEAADGEEAIKRANEIEPDLVITDIRMPKMDGLALCSYLSQRFPKCILVILSVYDEFHYVQNAMRVGASDYILKPVSQSGVLEALKVVKENYNKKFGSQTEAEAHNFEKDSANLTSLLFKPSEKLAKLVEKALKLEDASFLFSVFIVELDDVDALLSLNDEDYSMVMEKVGQGIEESSDDKTRLIVADTDLTRFVAVAIAKETGEIKVAAETARKIIKEKTGYVSTVFISSQYESISNIHLCYREALSCTNAKYVLGADRVITLNDNVRQSQQIWDILAYRDNSDLYDAIENQNQSKIEKSIADIFGAMKKNGSEQAEIKALLIGIISDVNQIFSQYKCDAREILKVENIDEAFFNNKTIGDMEKWFIKFCIYLSDYLAEVKKYRPSKISEKVKKIVENSCSDELTLKSLAKELYMSSVYLGQLFKNETGKTFNQYLSDIRIKKATRMLLTTDLSICEISEKVGYKAIGNFYSIFKKIKGCSPVEFRKQYGGKGDDNDSCDKKGG